MIPLLIFPFYFTLKPVCAGVGLAFQRMYFPPPFFIFRVPLFLCFYGTERNFDGSIFVLQILFD